MFGGGDSPFSDFFQTFFGGGGGASGAERRGGRGRTRQQKGRDVEHEFELDLESAARGSVQRLALRHDGEARSVEVRIPRRGGRRLAGPRGRRRRSRHRRRGERRPVPPHQAEAASRRIR